LLNGAHIVIYSKDPEADRAFFQQTLHFPSIDAGHGWLIFALPAAELAFHGHTEIDKHEMYFTCANLKAYLASLQKKGIQPGEISEDRWGTRTTIPLPGGGKIGLYEPKHPVTFSGTRKTKKTKGRSKLPK
jgi:hypothetical protein